MPYKGVSYQDPPQLVTHAVEGYNISTNEHEPLKFLVHDQRGANSYSLSKFGFEHEDWRLQYHIAYPDRKSLLGPTREIIQPDGGHETLKQNRHTGRIGCPLVLYGFSHEKLIGSYFFPTWPAQAGMPSNGDDVYSDIKLKLEGSKVYEDVMLSMKHADWSLSSTCSHPLVKKW